MAQKKFYANLKYWITFSIVFLAIYIPGHILWIMYDDASEERKNKDSQHRPPYIVSDKEKSSYDNISKQTDTTKSDNNEAHLDSNANQNKSDQYHWRKSEQIELTKSKSWMTSKITSQTDVEQLKIEQEKYPPENWHETEDLELYFVYYHAQLIKQFGNIEQVKTIVDTEYKVKNDIELKLDEQIEYLEAQNYLWPDQRTQKVLNQLMQLKDNEENQTHIHSDDHSH